MRQNMELERLFVGCVLETRLMIIVRGWSATHRTSARLASNITRVHVTHRVYRAYVAMRCQLRNQFPAGYYL